LEAAVDQAYSCTDLRTLLSEAVKKVPSVRYALGVAGIGVAAAIVYGVFQGDAQTAVLGTAIMIGFMVLLLVFASLTPTKSKNIQYAGFVLVWVTVACFCAVLLFLSSSFFFRWPIQQFGRGESSDCIAAANRMQVVRQSIANFISEQCVLANRLSIFVTNGTPDDWQRVTEKARTYYSEVNELQHKMSGEPDLFEALPPSSFTHFNELLDQKGGVAADQRLREDAPPSDRLPLEKLAEQLRGYATEASKETASLQTFRPSSCPRPTAVPITTTPCTKRPD
jgi:hypothetical protein